MKKTIFTPLFIIGLALRLGLVLLMEPTPVTEWYLPFLDTSISQLTLDPWALWLAHGGTSIAFPYGYVMWACFLPLLLLCKLFGAPLLYGYGLTVLGADLALFALLKKTLKNRRHLLLVAYWLSPIVITASYILGFNDLIPVYFLTLSLFLMKQRQVLLAALVMMVAVSAKLSMVLALPFFLIYLVHNRAMRQFFPAAFKGILIGTALSILPFFALSPAGVSMIFSNPEIGKIYRLAINFGSGVTIYIVPLIYLLTLYVAWRVRRLNFELFQAIMGTAFLLVVLLTPASPGWFIWAIPLLVTYQLNSDKISIYLVGLFSALYVLSSLLLIASVKVLLGRGLALTGLILSTSLGENLASLVHTGMVATGLILATRIWREAITKNDFFRLSRKPFVLGIAGDSGAGKDTFSDALKALFGGHSVTTLSGDDYHLWDRHKPMWQVMTHLNPMANDLEGFATDLVSLTDGKAVSLRHYDHQTGRMSRPHRLASNDIIIASGLHALYLPILRECYNLSIYLDIDEDLRRHFKMQRDVHQRGHTVEKALASFAKREGDSAKFIRPQVIHADLILSLQPIHPRMLSQSNAQDHLRFKLVAKSRHHMNELTLTRVLIGICGLHVDMVSSKDSSEIELTIEGETSAQDVALAAEMICPRIFEFLDFQPKWQDGVMGIMQLITLTQINQALTKRML